MYGHSLFSALLLFAGSLCLISSCSALAPAASFNASLHIEGTYAILNWDPSPVQCTTLNGVFQSWIVAWKYDGYAESTWANLGNALNQWYPGYAELPAPSQWLNPATPSIVNIRLQATCTNSSAAFTSPYVYANLLIVVPMRATRPTVTFTDVLGEGWMYLQVTRPSWTCEKLSPASTSMYYHVQVAPTDTLYLTYDHFISPAPVFYNVLNVSNPLASTITRFNVSMGLAPSQPYFIRVRLVCSNDSQTSEHGFAASRTELRDPADTYPQTKTRPPEFPTVLQKGTRSIRLQYFAPFAGCNVFTSLSEGYKIVVSPANAPQVQMTFACSSLAATSSVPRSVVNCDAKGLQVNTMYTISAYTMCGTAGSQWDSNPSDSHSVTTYNDLSGLFTLVSLPTNPIVTSDLVKKVLSTYASGSSKTGSTGNSLNAFIQQKVVGYTQSIQFYSLSDLSDLRFSFFYYDQTLYSSCSNVVNMSLQNSMYVVSSLTGGVAGSVYNPYVSFSSASAWVPCMFAESDLRLAVAGDFSFLYDIVPWKVSPQYATVALSAAPTINSVVSGPYATLSANTNAMCAAGASVAFIETQTQKATGSWSDVTASLCSVSPSSSEAPLYLDNTDVRPMLGIFNGSSCFMTVYSALTFSVINTQATSQSSITAPLRFRVVCTDGSSSKWNPMSINIPAVVPGAPKISTNVQYATRMSIGFSVNVLATATLTCPNLAIYTNLEKLEVQYAEVGVLDEILRFSLNFNSLGFDGVPKQPLSALTWTTVPYQASNPSQSKFVVVVPQLNPSRVYAFRVRLSCADAFYTSRVYSSWVYGGNLPTRSLMGFNGAKYTTTSRGAQFALVDPVLTGFGCAWAQSRVHYVSRDFALLPSLNELSSVALTLRARAVDITSLFSLSTFISTSPEVPFIAPGSALGAQIQEECEDPSATGTRSSRFSVMTRLLSNETFNMISPTTVFVNDMTYFSLKANDDVFGDIFSFYFVPSTSSCSMPQGPFGIFNGADTVLDNAFKFAFTATGSYMMCVRSFFTDLYTFRFVEYSHGRMHHAPVRSASGAPILINVVASVTPPTMTSSYLTAIQPNKVFAGISYSFSATTMNSAFPIVVLPVSQPSCVGTLASLKQGNGFSSFFTPQVPIGPSRLYFCVSYVPSTGLYALTSDPVLQTVSVEVTSLQFTFLWSPTSRVFSPGQFVTVTWPVNAQMGITQEQPVLIGFRRFSQTKLANVAPSSSSAESTFRSSFIVSLGSVFDTSSSLHYGTGSAVIAVPNVFNNDVLDSICITFVTAGMSTPLDECGLGIFQMASCGTAGAGCVSANYQSSSGVALSNNIGVFLRIPPGSIQGVTNQAIQMATALPLSSTPTQLPMVNGTTLPSPPGSLNGLLIQTLSSPLLGLYPHGLVFSTSQMANSTIDIPFNVPAGVVAADIPYLFKVLRLPLTNSQWMYTTTTPELRNAKEFDPNSQYQWMYRVTLTGFSYYGVFAVAADSGGGGGGGSSDKPNVVAIVVPIVVVFVLAVGGAVVFVMRKAKKTARAGAADISGSGSSASYVAFADRA
eukprot:ANDGO_08170.mRNA.1 hypothetical protein